MITNKRILILLVFILTGFGCSFSQNSDAIKKYNKYLSGLSASDYKNVSLAMDYYVKNISILSPGECDLGYVIFRIFYDKVDSVFSVVLGTGDPNFTPRQNIYIRAVDPKYENENDVIAFNKSLAENGFYINAGSEPGYYVGELKGFMVDKFGKYVSPVISEYLRLREVDLQNPAFYDIYIWITPEEMANRLKDWDKYLSDYPNSPVFEKAKSEMNRYLINFLGVFLSDVESNPNGETNLMAFDLNGNMTTEGKSLYEKLILECGNSYLGNLFRDYYSVLKKTGFKRNSQTIEFLKSRGFEVYEEN